MSDNLRLEFIRLEIIEGIIADFREKEKEPNVTETYTYHHPGWVPEMYVWVVPNGFTCTVFEDKELDGEHSPNYRRPLFGWRV